MTKSTSGKMTLLAAATLVAGTVGMTAEAADTASPGQPNCPKQSIFIKYDGSGAKQIKGDCQLIKHDATHIKMETRQIKTTGPAPLTITGNAGTNVVPGSPSTQIKKNSSQIKLQASHVKGESTDDQSSVKSPRDSASGLATGR